MNWGPCGIEWPKYQQYLSNTPEPVGPSLVGITSLTFRHTEFIGTGGVLITEAQDLETISFPNLTAITTVQDSPPSTSYLLPLMFIVGCPALTTISFPVLSAFGGYRAADSLVIERNPNLTLIDLPVLSLTSPLDFASIDLRENALSQACVDNILARIDASPVPASSKSLRLNLGANSAPSASGLVSKASLISKGWVVTTN